MTTLNQAIKERGISLYSVLRHMGINPRSMQGQWKKKITGERVMNIEDLNRICKSITEVSGKPLTIYDIKIEPKTVYVR